MEMSEKVKQSILIRGVCSALQAMNFPNIDNLIELFNKVGIRLTVKNKDDQIND